MSKEIFYNRDGTVTLTQGDRTLTVANDETLVSVILSFFVD